MFSNKTPQQRTIEAMDAIANEVLAFRNQRYIDGFNLIWNNPWGLTAQQALDAFGTDAPALLVKSQSEKAHINQQGKSVSFTPDGSFVFTGDDVCTVTAPCDSFGFRADGSGVDIVFAPAPPPADTVDGGGA